jgi:tetratricopeptide (TPR) repeat protein
MQLLAGDGRPDRRWAGAFRVCEACGGRNWVGARRCRSCEALLVGARAVSRPPAAMIGRREADRVMTPRVRWFAIGAAVLALVAGGILLKMFRTDGFLDRRVAGAAGAPQVAEPQPEPVAEPSDEPRPMETTRALRAADRGRALLGRGEVKDAVVLLAEAVRALPEDAELANVYGTALWSFGARDRALFQYQRAVKLSPDAESYRQDLARALSALGRPAQAAHVLYGPAGPLPMDGGGPPVSLDEGVNMGGAGSGSFKGRRTFTDDDLARGRVAAPPAAPSAAPSPSPEDLPR